MATTGTYLHLEDSDEPTTRRLGKASVSVTVGDSHIFVTSPGQAQALMDALAEAASILMAEAEPVGTDEQPGIDLPRGVDGSRGIDGPQAPTLTHLSQDGPQAPTLTPEA